MAASEMEKGEADGTTEQRSCYVGYAADDPTYFGARDIIAEEARYIRCRRNEDTADTTLPKDLTGLALSGGGIRSASFSLGVLQALAHNGWLKNVDYLSTVSGGGYIGSSVSWLLSRPGEETRPLVTASDTPIECPSEDGRTETPPAQSGKRLRFGLGRDDFPYGTYPMSGSNPRQRVNAAGDADDSIQLPHRYRGKLLRYLRQQARYLTPGGGINAMSLVAVILRGMMVSVVVYFGLLLAAIVGLFPALIPSPGDSPVNGVLLSACAVAIAYVFLSFLYAFATRPMSKPSADAGESTAAEGGARAGKSSAYRWRQRYERWGGKMLTVSLLLLLIGLVPVVHDTIAQWTGETAVTRGVAVSPGDREAGIGITTVGYLSTLLGALSTVFAFFKGGSGGKRRRIPLGMVALLASALVVFGLLLLAYHYGTAIHAWVLTLGLPPWPAMLLAATFIAVLSTGIGMGTHINYVSIHRYYRDRLMELFMPDVDKALCDVASTRAACRADKAGLHELIPSPEDCETARHSDNAERPPLPYHIINANVVLEASGIPKFRGRGGDNFILTPYFCGSNATGWCRSRSFMGGRMTLPTAMAISGAAVNPGTGVGGQGVTRQPLLSMLMGLLNIRLGYWAPNPDPAPKERDVARKPPCDRRRGGGVPNFIFPGLCEIFTRWRMHEKADFVQLTDGGHFENLALYELIRRRAKVIVVCDGGADPDYQFTDFANAVEKVRTDFGVLVLSDAEELQKLVPGDKGSEGINDEDIRGAERGHLVCSIIYPDGSHGRLIYLKTTFFKSLSADLYGYKKTHPQFPDEPTSDQFFDEKQFEAYRELGFQTAWQMMESDEIRNDALIWQHLARSQ